MTLFHGSENIIEKPKYGLGKKYNDYGLGFYMTKDIELAKEWSARENLDKSYVSEYEIEEQKLNILDLDTVEDKVLRWITLLLNYRVFDTKFPNSDMAKDFLIEKYLIDVEKYDMIKGYRADDCYFMFARSFLYNQISLEQLGKALILGKLGNQYVIKSKKAFNLIKFKRSYEVNSKEYYIKRILRNRKAADEYTDVIDKYEPKDIYLSDIIKKYYNETRKNKKNK